MSVQEFRNYAIIDEFQATDSLLQTFITPAIAYVARLTGKEIEDLPDDSASLKLAVNMSCLELYNQRDFPSRAIQESVEKKL